MKQVVIIYHDNKPVECLEIKAFPDATSFLKFKNECEQNMLKVKQEEQRKIDEFNKLSNKVSELELKIKLLMGEIDEKEYELCLGK